MIPKSSYYKWTKRKESKTESENKVLVEKIIELYEEVNGIYGYRRITMNLNRSLRKSYNHKRIRRLMQKIGLKSVIRQKKRHYMKSNPQYVAENLLNRQFKANKPNEKWVTDVTELKYGISQKAYLSAILGLHDNTIISYV